MGLDMFAFVTTSEIPEVDFDDVPDTVELHYWRKHPNLHGWMERLYRKKGGKEEEFNCATVRLTAKDLAWLSLCVRWHLLPFTTGFFFGESRPEHQQEDLDFIVKARAAIAEGKNVFYTSWW